jgi:hypothetical protein
MPAKAVAAAGVIPLAALTRGMARQQANGSTTTNTPATTSEPEHHTNNPLTTRQIAQKHAYNALYRGATGQNPPRGLASTIVIPDDGSTDTTDDDWPPPRTGASPTSTPEQPERPERPRRYSAPVTPGPTASYTPSRPPQPVQPHIGLLARRREQAILNKSPVRTSGVTAGKRINKAPASPILGTSIPATPAAPAAPGTTAPATTAQPSQEATATAAPLTASMVARNTVALYEEVQRVADGLEQLIRKHVARFPSEACRLSQHMASAFATFVNPQPTARTPDQTTTGAPDTRTSSYAAVAAASVQLPPTQRQLALAPKTQRTTANLPQHQPATRIFARLPADHPLRKADPVAVREKANSTPGLTNLFISAYHVPSGLALVTADAKAAATVLAQKASLQIALRATVVEAAERWDAYLLTGVPRTVQSLAGPVVVDTSIAIEEIATATGVRPRQARWTKRTLAEQLPTTIQGEMVLHLPHGAPSLPVRLRLFGRLATVRPLHPQSHQTKPCGRCHQYHNPYNCSRTPRCKNCSRTEHDTSGPCPWPPRCGNCRGPHSATDLACPARPCRVNGAIRRPNPQQLQAIRAAGSLAWTSANPTTAGSNEATRVSPAPSVPNSRSDRTPPLSLHE